MPFVAGDSSYLCSASAVPISGNSVELLCDGAEVLPRMLDEIQGARESIAVEMYHFASDSVGNRFARALADRARRGVRVRVLVDAAGSHRTPRSFFGWMRSQRIEVQGVHPLRQLLSRGWNAAASWRDHRKLLVIDDDASFVGGLNWCREGADVSEGGGGWHDAAVRVRGPVVARLSRLFEGSWREQGPALGGPSTPAAIPAPAGEVPAVVLNSRGTGRRSLGGALRHAIRNARERVWVANPYFLPPHSLRRSLIRAARRGVDVRILLPGLSDCRLVKWASQRSYAGYLRAGVRLFEWAGSMMHAKLAVVDGLWSTIGSSNLDPLSFFRNRELNLALMGREIGARFENLLAQDYSRSAEIEKGTWVRRGALRRLTERLCAAFRVLL